MMIDLKTNLSREVLKLQRIPDKQIDLIVDTSKKVFNKIPNVYNNIESNVGLIVGKVQSGKTSVMISTAAVAFENGHSLVIALLSDTELLLAQNFERIRSTFSKYENISVYQVSKQGDFSGLTQKDLSYIHRFGGKVLVCALKNKTRLGEIANKFIGTGFENDKVLIFDDEGDDISQNTASNKYKFDVDDRGNYYENEFSATNNAIKKLKQNFKSFGYISVTATPQSIVMLQKFQHLSPSYVITTEPGVGYCGLSYFHEEHRDELIRIINDDINILKNQFGIPTGLKQAMGFFVAGCIYRLRSGNLSKLRHSMMIHASRLLIDHETVFRKIKSYTDQIFEGIRDESQISLSFFEYVKESFREISRGEDVEDVSFDEMYDVFEGLRVTSINGKSALKDINKIQSIMPFHIFIGGDLLDRGVTISGLAVSYIVRETERAQMDTLLQRARWFGYKADYIKTCRVYMTELLDEQFTDAVEADDTMWDLLVECSENNVNPMDMDFEFNLDKNIMIPTSSRKSLFDIAVTGVKTSQKYVMMNKRFNDENIELVKTFKSMFKSDISEAKYGPIIHEKLVIKAKYIFDFLKQFHFSEEETLCNYAVFKDVFERLKYNVDSLVEVLFIHRPDGIEERSTQKPNTHRLIGLLQGHSPNREPSDPLYYKGDRYLVDNLPMIQIHMVTLKNDVQLEMTEVMLHKGTIVPMIAWMFPESSYKKIVIKKKVLGSSDE